MCQRRFIGIPFSTSLRLHIPFGLPLDIGVGDDRIITLGITSGGDGSGVSTGTLHGIEDESASIGPTYEEDGDNVSVSQVMGKEHHCILSSGQGHQTDSCTMSMSQLYNQEGNNSSVSVGNSYDKTKNVASHKIGKGQSTIKSFGGCDDDPGRLIYNYEMLMGQPSVHIPNAIDSVGLVKSNDGGRIAVPGAGDNSKKGELHMTEKIPSNNFPSNVRSLLSTGILDGVHVKYMAWSQEKDLPGIIRGCGYLCGCSSCNRSKVHSPHTITPCMALIYMPYSYILRATLRSSQTLCGLEHFKIGFPCSHGLVPGLTGRALIAEASSSPIVFLFLSSFSFFALTRCCSA